MNTALNAYRGFDDRLFPKPKVACSTHAGATSFLCRQVPEEGTMNTWHPISYFLLFSLFFAISQAQTDHGHASNKSHRNLLLVVNQGDQRMSLFDHDAGV